MSFNRSKFSAAAVGVALVASFTVVGLTGCSGRVDLRDQVADTPPTQTLSYTGSVQTVTVPAGVTSVTITATGGDGGYLANQATNQFGGAGSVVTGTLAVTPGQVLSIGVGGVGQDGYTSSSDPGGGWGALGMHGGAGKGEKDHFRASAAGGGASTVQVSAPDGSDTATVLVAAGGGGRGGASGDPASAGDGGDAGTGWSGQNGTKGSVLAGGSAGKAGAESSGTGGDAGHASGEGGNGGGGGGGVEGGSGGGGAKGTSAGGGGGSGTSATTGMTATSITTRDDSTPSNGLVVISWSDL